MIAIFKNESGVLCGIAMERLDFVNDFCRMNDYTFVAYTKDTKVAYDYIVHGYLNENLTFVDQNKKPLTCSCGAKYTANPKFHLPYCEIK